MAAPDDGNISSSLEEVFFDHRGALSDKWEQYLGIYESEFHRFLTAAKPVELLEIGVQNGGSLQIWSKYFPAGTRVTGLDVDERCGKLRLGDGIDVIIGDAADAMALDRLLGDRQFDIIIDDGSHRSDHIIETFKACFERVCPGGLYAVEDLHCSYFASHAGGFRVPGAAIEYFKNLLDCMNVDYFEDNSGIDPEECATLTARNADIARMTFYDSVLVIEKSGRPKTEPYRRVISGADASVVNLADEIPKFHARQLRGLVLSRSAAAEVGPTLQVLLANAKDEASALRYNDANLEYGSSAVGREAAALKQHVLALENRLSAANLELESMRGSRAWKAALLTQSAARRLPLPFRKAALSMILFSWKVVASLIAPARPTTVHDRYVDWCNAREPNVGGLMLQRRMANNLESQPRFSILVPLYRTPVDVFHAMVESVCAQTYQWWELVLVLADTGPDCADLKLQSAYHAGQDDRIKLRVLPENLGISNNTNAALEMATGRWCLLLDHDDMLAPTALYHMACAIDTNPDACFIYSDKDHVDRSGHHRSEPLLKPAWSPEIMLNANYITHLNAIPTDVLRQIGGWDPSTDGAQDWDIFLRCIGQSDAVVHVPAVLYHWRKIDTSVSVAGLATKPYAAEAQLRTLRKYLPAAGWVGADARHDGNNIRILWPAVASESICTIVMGRAPDGVHSVVVPRHRNEVIVLPDDNLAADLDRTIAATSCEIVVLVDAAFHADDENWSHELTGPLANPKIALVAGIVFDQRRLILDYGTFLQEGVAMPGFRGESAHYFGAAGGTGWYRNAVAAAGGALGFRRSLWFELGGFAAHADDGRPDLAFTMAATSQGLGRLMLNPFARFQANRPSGFERHSRPLGWRKIAAAYPAGDPFLSPHLQASVSGAPSLPAIETRRPSVPHDYAAEARYLARTLDVTDEQIAQSIQACAAMPGGPLRRILWVLPEFDVPFYGGIHTILRAADHMRRHHGVRMAFAVFGGITPAAVTQRIGQAFPDLARDAEVFCFMSADDRLDVGPVDAAICTLWNTAYPLLKLRDVRRKFYFVQDWEPLFYPAGTISSMVETSYRFGFHALCNTPALAESYRALGGQADSFVPALDGKIFNSRGRGARDDGGPFVLVCYARPGTPRNCFEAVAQGLSELKERHGEKIQIVSAGAGWNPVEYGLETVVTDVGLVPYRENGSLYRAADAGLVAMATRHPSYIPLELMACGAGVVTNRNPYTTWLLRDGENSLLCELTRSSIADAVTRLIEQPETLRTITAGGLTTVASAYSDWNTTCENIHEIIRQTTA